VKHSVSAGIIITATMMVGVTLSPRASAAHRGGHTAVTRIHVRPKCVHQFQLVNFTIRVVHVKPLTSYRFSAVEPFDPGREPQPPQFMGTATSDKSGRVNLTYPLQLLGRAGRWLVGVSSSRGFPIAQTHIRVRPRASRCSDGTP